MISAGIVLSGWGRGIITAALVQRRTDRLPRLVTPVIRRMVNNALRRILLQRLVTSLPQVTTIRRHTAR